MAAVLRLAVRQRAEGRCEYCRFHEEDFLFEHEPDHIIAAQHGGASVPENLAWACSRCNRRKGTNLSSVDPDSGTVVALFHPRQDNWGEHFTLEGPRIVGLTPTGRATVFLLQLNSDERVRIRRQLQRAGRYPRPV